MVVPNADPERSIYIMKYSQDNLVMEWGREQWDRDGKETKRVSDLKQSPKEGTVAPSTGELWRHCRG